MVHQVNLSSYKEKRFFVWVSEEGEDLFLFVWVSDVGKIVSCFVCASEERKILC